ncbi:MAG: sulfatase-like hydrolase/transferase [Sandaracinaceae bacterium]
MAGLAAMRTDESGLAGFAAMAAASLLAFGAGLLPSLALAFVADREALQRLGRGLRYAVAGSAPLATVALLLVAALGVLASTLAAPVFAEMMSERFARVATAMSTVVATLGAALLVVPPLDALGRASGSWARRPVATWVVAVLIAAGVLAVCVETLPTQWAPAPAAYVVGFAAGSSRPIATAWRGRREAASVVALALLSVVAVLGLEALPGAAKNALLYHAPYVGNLLSVASDATDGDGDGYGAHFLGGDCDDTSRFVHPGAVDEPGNGIDENCAGGDAQPYSPPAPPRVALPPLPPRQNVVLIMLDALRPDHLSFAGYARPTTPRLDRFFEDAVFFDNAYTAAPSTRFAMTAAFTGQDPRRAPHRDLGGNRFELSADANTFAEALSEAGYQSQGYSISYVLQHNRGLGQGFDDWDSPWPSREWRSIYPVAAERTTDASLRALADFEGTEAEPYLLFSHYRCTHDPYIAYDEFPYGRRAIDRYDSALSYCDQQIGRLLDGIAERPDHDRTTVVVFSDHGEMFGEHELTSHGNSLYENDVRIVLAARVPTVRGRRVRTPVLLTDLAPTVRQLAGLEPGSDDGWSLLLHLGEEPLPPRPLFFFTDLWRGSVHVRASGVLRWPMKLIRDIRTGDVQLYDVEADPEESNELSGRRPEVRRALAASLERYEGYARQ